MRHAPPAKDDITRQLEHMLASPDFHATPQQTALLKYVVNQTLAGKAREIKDATVAAAVFGREADFDRSIDPIVSIQADILRRVLARYYQRAGKKDSIRIDIPPGTYVPVFKKRKLKGLWIWDLAPSSWLIGNIEDDRKSAAELLKLKPDFAERWQMLIWYYIKFKDIVERVIKGLNAIGAAVW